MIRTEHPQPGFRVRSRRLQPPPRRAGLIAFELFLMLPILLIFLAAVVEFGLILSMVQSVESANRYGANCTKIEMTCLPGGATVESTLVGIVNSRIGSSLGRPYLASSQLRA